MAVAELNNHPETAPRSPTDISCSFLFSVCATILGIVLCMSFHGSSLKHFQGLPDHSGRICGVSHGVAHKPFLFLCDNKEEEYLGHTDRICVKSCTMDAARGCNLVDTPNNLDDKPKPYEMTNYAGIVCMPTDRGFSHMFTHIFLEDSYTTVMLLGIAFVRSWPAIFCAGAIAICLSFLYLHMMRMCGRTYVIMGLGLIVTTSLLFGAYLIHVAHHFGADGIPGTGDSDISRAMGICLVVFSALVMTVMLLWRNNIKSSIACIKAGSECMQDMPSIFFEPFLALAWRLCAMAVLILGFLHMVAWLGSDETGTVFQLHGRWYHRLCMAFYIIMSAWILEASSAISYFAISYATQQWFFADYNKILMSKDAPTYSTCTAYRVALRYHLGTLFFGSFLIMVLRVPRMVLSAFVYSGRRTDTEVKNQDPSPDSGRCARCWCCRLYEDFLKCMTPHAYMDVALNGTRFLKGASRATSTLQHKSVAFFTAHSAPWLIQFTGLCFVSAAGGAITYFVCRFSYLFFEVGPKESVVSSLYVPVPSLVGLYAAVICGCVAMPFMLLIGHVSDNIIFCYAVENQRLETQPLTTVIDSVSEGMLSRFSCAGRVHHQAASTRAQPPYTQSLLEEALHDSPGCI